MRRATRPRSTRPRPLARRSPQPDPATPVLATALGSGSETPVPATPVPQPQPDPRPGVPWRAVRVASPQSRTNATRPRRRRQGTPSGSGVGSGSRVARPDPDPATPTPRPRDRSRDPDPATRPPSWRPDPVPLPRRRQDGRPDGVGGRVPSVEDQRNPTPTASPGVPCHATAVLARRSPGASPGDARTAVAADPTPFPWRGRDPRRRPPSWRPLASPRSPGAPIPSRSPGVAATAVLASPGVPWRADPTPYATDPPTPGERRRGIGSKNGTTPDPVGGRGSFPWRRVGQSATAVIAPRVLATDPVGRNSRHTSNGFPQPRSPSCHASADRSALVA